ncbi:MAG: sodium:solute symporter [Bacteroidota bacterium]
MDTISSLDITIIIAYFALVLLIGIWVGRKAKTGEDLFLGGRSLTWGFIGLSLFASNISSTTLVGLAGAAYTTGIVQSVYEWGSALPFAILALIFVPLYIKSKITTIPEFLELRFDRRARMFFSSLTVVASIMIDTAGSLYAGALVIQIFFPQIELWQTCYALALFTGIYTSIGGLKAVVYTDAIQAVILIFGASALTYLLFEQLDFSWTKVVGSAPEGHFSVVKPLDDEGLPWPGLLLGVPMLGFWYMATNQYITQRVLGAKDIRHARWGVMLAGLLKFLPLFIMVLPGAMAISLFPTIENSDMVFPTMVIETLPIGLIGLVLAGLISAIMSSISSTLNSASTLVVVDFIKPNNPNMSEKSIVRATRISTLVFMVIAALWAPQIINFGGLWTYLQQMYSIFVPPVIVLFGVGILYKRGNGDGAFWTLIIGALIGVLFFVLGIYELWPVHYTINIGIVVALCTVIFIIVSRNTPAPDYEKIKPYLYRKSLINEGNENMPWYKDYRYQVAVLMVLFVLSYVVWW